MNQKCYIFRKSSAKIFSIFRTPIFFSIGLASLQLIRHVLFDFHENFNFNREIVIMASEVSLYYQECDFLCFQISSNFSKILGSEDLKNEQKNKNNTIKNNKLSSNNNQHLLNYQYELNDNDSIDEINETDQFSIGKENSKNDCYKNEYRRILFPLNMNDSNQTHLNSINILINYNTIIKNSDIQILTNTLINSIQQLKHLIQKIKLYKILNET